MRSTIPASVRRKIRGSAREREIQRPGGPAFEPNGGVMRRRSIDLGDQDVPLCLTTMGRRARSGVESFYRIVPE
jgi:hypothetical protein